MNTEQLKKKIAIYKEAGWYFFTYKDDPTRGYFDDIKDRLYVKKEKYRDYDNYELQEFWSGAISVKFDMNSIDDEFIEKIYNHHLDLISKGKAKTFAEALQNTFDYFASNFSDKNMKIINGDIGEALFILKTHEFTNKNVMNNMHLRDNGLYDFSFNNGKYIEIKSTSPDKNEVVLTNCQIDYVKDRDFVILKFKLIENASNIIDLYDQIKLKVGPLSDLLKQKYYDYSEFKEIKKFSVNLDSVKIGVLKNDLVPIVEIKNESALKKSKFYIDVTDGLDPFDSYIKTVNLD